MLTKKNIINNINVIPENHKMRYKNLIITKHQRLGITLYVFFNGIC